MHPATGSAQHHPRADPFLHPMQPPSTAFPAIVYPLYLCDLRADPVLCALCSCVCFSARYPGSQGKQYFLGLEAVLGGSGDPAYPGMHGMCVQ